MSRQHAHDTMSAVDVDWWDQAACHGYRTKIFFPREPNEIDPTAAALCAACPVRSECLNHALDNHEAGTWGGTTEPGRTSIRRRRYTRLGISRRADRPTERSEPA